MHARQARLARPLTVLGVCALVSASLTAAASAAPPQPGGGDPCPQAAPVDQLTPGQRLEGLTVDTATTPAPFDAEVIGVLSDAIAPGIDLVMIEASSPAIDAAGGIWAGMSGSPVYTRDGALVGAVAYGLAVGASPVAGVTPAAAMYELRSAASAPVSTPESVALPSALRTRLVTSGLATTTEATAGLEVLPAPLAISGVSVSAARTLDRRLGSRLDLSHAYASGSAQAAAPVVPAAPGGNAAVALSYGDFTAAAVGTTTAVCDNEALVFGHPFQFEGATTASLHSATALYVQKDLFAPFKVANPGGVLGTVTQDRLAGVLATLGTAPAAIPVSSTMTNLDTLRTRSGRTTVTAPSWAADLAAYHTLVNAQRVLDSGMGGVARVTVTATGTADGQPWSLTRRDIAADRWDLAYTVGSLVYSPLAQVLEFPRAAATVDDVRIDATFDEQITRYSLDAVHVKVGTRWVALGGRTTPVVQAGSPVTLRLTLYPYRSAEPVRTTMRLPAPRPGSAFLSVSGGQSGWEDDGDLPPTLAALIDGIEDAPRGDQVVATWQARRDTTTVKQLSRYVWGSDGGDVRVVR